MAHTQHDYELDKAHVESLQQVVSGLDKALKKFPRGAMGLTPDSVKATSEWKATKKAYDIAFSHLRKFNAVFVKKYKKEVAIERLERRKAGNL